MKTHFITSRPMALAAICGLALAAGVVATRAHADEWDQRTVLTVSQPIQVRQVLLDPGTYVLKLMDTQSGQRNVVQIYTADERHLVDTVQAINAYRPRPTDGTQFTYWETPTGTARALRAWYYPGQLIGQGFPYPNQPLEVASTASTTASTASIAAPAVVPMASAQTSTASPAELAASSNTGPPEPEAEQPVEVAQNAAPAPAPASEPAAAAPGPRSAPDQPASAPADMPKTASPFPLIGLTGMLSLGLGGLLRAIRSS